VATADIAEVSRPAESSNGSKDPELILAVVAGVLVALYWGLMYVAAASGN
jgi:hypothetical protein